MKTYEQLTDAQKAKALKIEVNDLLTFILEYGIRFSDELSGDDLQVRIDAARQKSEDMYTPWFASEYIMDTCREDLEGMAQCTIEDALYPDSNEHIIYIPAE